MIEEHNAEYEAGRTSWYMAVNKFADLTHDEFKAQYASGLLNIAKPTGLAAPKANTKVNLKDLPEKKDWRDDGVITAVKDQGMCGSCWAFATGMFNIFSYRVFVQDICSAIMIAIVSCQTLVH